MELSHVNCTRMREKTRLQQNSLLEEKQANAKNSVPLIARCRKGSTNDKQN